MKEKKIKFPKLSHSQLFRNVRYNYLIFRGKFDKLSDSESEKIEEFLADPKKFIVDDEEIIYDELKDVIENGAKSTNEKVIEAAKVFFASEEKAAKKNASKKDKESKKDAKKHNKEAEKNQKKLEKNTQEILKNFNKSPEFSLEVKNMINTKSSGNILKRLKMTNSAIDGERLLSYVSKYISDIDTNIINSLSRSEKEFCNCLSEALNFGKIYPDISSSTIASFDVRSSLFSDEADFIIDSDMIKSKLANADFVRKVNEKKEFLSLHPEDDAPEETTDSNQDSGEKLYSPFEFMDANRWACDLRTGEWYEKEPENETPPEKIIQNISFESSEIVPDKVYSLQELRELVLKSPELAAILGYNLTPEQVIIHPGGWVFANIKHTEGIEEYKFDVNLIPGTLSLTIPLKEPERMISLNGVRIISKYVSVPINEPIVKTTLSVHRWTITVPEVPPTAMAIWDYDFEAIKEDQAKMMAEQSLIQEIQQFPQQQMQESQWQVPPMQPIPQQEQFMPQFQPMMPQMMFQQQIPFMQHSQIIRGDQQGFDPYAMQQQPQMPFMQQSQIIRADQQGFDPYAMQQQSQMPFMQPPVEEVISQDNNNEEEVKIVMRTEDTPSVGAPNPAFNKFADLIAKNQAKIGVPVTP